MKKLLIAVSCLAALVLAPQLALAGSAQLLLDARTGRVLASENPDELNHPASLTKMMTLYMTYDAIRRGKLSWSSKVPFSKHASARPPTKLWVKPGDSITVREAVMALIVVSANDAAAALAEKLGGTESQFAEMMTERARALGMTRTVFRNASGLPDKRQVTTARDMSTLGVALLRDFPEEYKLFNTKSFAFRGKTIRGHNNLMYRYRGMDGIKTGYTNASGFNLVSAVSKGDRRVIGVVMGGRTAKSRDKIMENLIDGYIGQASGGSRLVASSGSASAVLARLGDNVPVPTPRHDRIAAVIGMAEANAPVPTARIETAYAGEAAASATLSRQTATEAVLSPPAGGWQIQIAAAETKQAALDLLSRVQSEVGGPLSGLQTYTEAVDTGGKTLYRARFVGFSDKDDAWAACATLKKRSMACLAVQG
ncbi:D-alanyl-D-alanine carboxypeptidase [Ciceribacter sp. L1K23]|uniref:D-alanyl-D-alanine carboxypeptidase n=1 Tax=Ciceribacter sp. L1K23 TaxID=2820276 RepID=UPI001B830279|nr:D-alanyl-D-alanine carboxypeptidase [Ciceribacter sp. L1K23]MBR0556705.1 D-alanyl-D-alanine carboxypeptidase [Ciceribacter sp. L1K23]